MYLPKHVGLCANTIRCKEGSPRTAIEILGIDEDYESICHEVPLRRNPASFLPEEGTAGSITMTIARELLACQGLRVFLQICCVLVLP